MYIFLVYILGQIAVKVAIVTNTLYNAHDKNKTLKIVWAIENTKESFRVWEPLYHRCKNIKKVPAGGAQKMKELRVCWGIWSTTKGTCSVNTLIPSLKYLLLSFLRLTRDDISVCHSLQIELVVGIHKQPPAWHSLQSHLCHYPKWAWHHERYMPQKNIKYNNKNELEQQN